MNIKLKSADQFLDAQEQLEEATRLVAIELHHLTNSDKLNELLITEICVQNSIEDYQLIIDTYNELLELNNPV